MKIPRLTVSFNPNSYVFLLCVLCVSISAQNWKTVHDGVEYARVEHKIGNDPVRINLLRLDLRKVRLDVHHALDKAIGLETTSSIAKRKGAVAAINGGFFRFDKSVWRGDSDGVLMLDGRLISEAPQGSAALWLDTYKTRTFAAISQLDTFVEAFSYAGIIKLSGVNRERKSKEIVLYDASFGQTTLTEKGGSEVIFSNCKPGTRKDEIGFKHPTILCSEFSYLEEVHNSSIPRNGVVLSFANSLDEKQSEFLKKFVAGPVRNKTIWTDGSVKYVFHSKRHSISFSPHISSAFTSYFGNDTDIVGGRPQLIKNGKIDVTWEQENVSKDFVETRHPRTAVAVLKDEKFLMATVDGREPGVSVGMNLLELAYYLFTLGAHNAMNLDGGGSTTMFLDGKVVNTPSDKEGERKIGDAIVVTLRKKK